MSYVRFDSLGTFYGPLSVFFLSFYCLIGSVYLKNSFYNLSSVIVMSVSFDSSDTSFIVSDQYRLTDVLLSWLRLLWWLTGISLVSHQYCLTHGWIVSVFIAHRYIISLSSILSNSWLDCVRSDCSGICGSPRLADVGGPPYLLPLPQKDKVMIKTITYCFS